MGKWLDALKPVFTEPLLTALEEAAMACLAEMEGRLTVESLREQSLETRTEITNNVEQLSTGMEELQKVTRGKRPNAVVLKSRAQAARDLLKKHSNIVKGLEVMEPVAALAATPQQLLESSDLQQALLDFIGTSGDLFAGWDSDLMQAAFKGCWKALACTVLSWAGNPGENEDVEKVKLLYTTSKRIDRLMKEGDRSQLLVMMDCGVQLRGRMVGTTNPSLCAAGHSEARVDAHALHH